MTQSAVRRTKVNKAPGNEPEAFVRSLVALIKNDQSTPIRTLVLTLRALSTYIHRVKTEVAAIGSDEIQALHLLSANDELEAIIQATAQASNAIMDATEVIQNTAMTLDEEPKTAILDAATRIFEACSFQDITGQRVNKVIGALRTVEDKLAVLVEVFDQDAGLPDASELPDNVDDISGRSLCHGPQLPNQAQTQADIDALFDSLG